MPRRPKIRVVTDPVESARIAGLRYINDGTPGIRRRRAGRGFAYRYPDGRRVRHPDDLRRIRALAIPPAWTDVWICPYANGHLQASGRDARGRKQYRYHARWRLVRDESKYNRMIAFAAALPRVRERVDEDLERPGLPRAKVLATVVRLLETTLFRVGNEEYARENGSFGLTTLRSRHVDVSGSTLTFQFRGKAGKIHKAGVRDRRVARIVRRCQELPGQELFQYVDDDGAVRSVDSADVNDYLREISGDDFTAKDFRTWSGTLLAARALAKLGTASSTRHVKRNVVRAVEEVAAELRNTPAVCRKCYVHPAVLTAYAVGVCLPLKEPAENSNGLEPDEHALVALLTAHATTTPTARAA